MLEEKLVKVETNSGAVAYTVSYQLLNAVQIAKLINDAPATETIHIF